MLNLNNNRHQIQLVQLLNTCDNMHVLLRMTLNIQYKAVIC